MLDVIWLIPALPLAGAIVLIVLGRRLGDPLAGWFAAAMCGASFLVAIGVHLALRSNGAEDRQVEQVLWQWMPVGGLHVDMAFLADPLSITMALFITGVATAIHVYAIGYMKGDPKFSKFFLYLNLFVAAMLVLVLANNLVVTFLGWEGVGVCSYWLISFWQTREEAATAGKKAFVTNRIGDVGFMLGTFWLFQATGSVNYLQIDRAAPTLAVSTATAAALLLFLGACGKSAQLPLSVWLPDAMAGPTPVSALIHAATMVTAGLFLMERVSPVITRSDSAGTVIAIVGIVTALWAAMTAVAQFDIKRVLAYSTVSQLGLMFVAVGTGAYAAGMFHVITHAFFKALLFLGAGSVIHGMSGEQDMRRMGGLAKYMPITFATYVVGWLAISGVPPFSGFWSKDELLLAAWEKSPVLWALALLASFLTAYYMTRQVILVFFGKPRWQEEEAHADAPVALAVGAAPNPEPHPVHPHESPWIMTIPLLVLAVPAAIAGVLQLPFASSLHHLENWLEPVYMGSAHESAATGTEKLVLAIVATANALLAIGLAYVVYARQKVKAIEPKVAEHAFYLDEGYAAFAGGPGYAAFEGAAWTDEHVIDGVVEGIGAVDLGAGGKVRKLQTGFVRNYALFIAIGGVAMIAWFVVIGMG